MPRTCARPTFLALLAVMAIVALLTGCSSPETPPAGPASSSDAPAAPRTADQVVAELVAKVPSARKGLTITSRNDPNKLLGRPGQYVSAATFTDTRIAKAARNPDKLSTDNGGKVEVFASPAEALRRRAYIERLAEASPIAVEYSYVSGPVLVRVTKTLAPEEAKQYEDALGSS